MSSTALLSRPVRYAVTSAIPLLQELAKPIQPWLGGVGLVLVELAQAALFDVVQVAAVGLR